MLSPQIDYKYTAAVHVCLGLADFCCHADQRGRSVKLAVQHRESSGGINTFHNDKTRVM